MEEVATFREHQMAVLTGQIPLDDSPFLSHGSKDGTSNVDEYRDRIHMLHRIDAVNERYLLHPKVSVNLQSTASVHSLGGQFSLRRSLRLTVSMEHRQVLDIVQCLIGPDVLALQTMQFFNRPKKEDGSGASGGGQGW